MRTLSVHTELAPPMRHPLVIDAAHQMATRFVLTVNAVVKLDTVVRLRISALILEAVFLDSDDAIPIPPQPELQLPTHQDQQRDLSHTQTISTIVCKTTWSLLPTTMDHSNIPLSFWTSSNHMASQLPSSSPETTTVKVPLIPQHHTQISSDVW